MPNVEISRHEFQSPKIERAILKTFNHYCLKKKSVSYHIPDSVPLYNHIAQLRCYFNNFEREYFKEARNGISTHFV